MTIVVIVWQYEGLESKMNSLSAGGENSIFAPTVKQSVEQKSFSNVDLTEPLLSVIMSHIYATFLEGFLKKENN